MSDRRYVANGTDSTMFESNEVLSQLNQHPLDDPPWKVIDNDFEFKPMEVDSLSSYKNTERMPVDQEAEGGADLNPNSDKSIDTIEFRYESDETDPTFIENCGSNKEDMNDASTPISSDTEEIISDSDKFNEILESRLTDALAEAESRWNLRLESEKQQFEKNIKESQKQAKLSETKALQEAEIRYQQRLDQISKDHAELSAKVLESTQDLSLFFEPLSKLAVKVAEELVRGELSIGPTAIARLVQGCLDQLEYANLNSSPILVMNPEDRKRYEHSTGKSLSGFRIQSDKNLNIGDVSLQVDDQIIEDFMSTKLNQLASQIFEFNSRRTNPKTAFQFNHEFSNEEKNEPAIPEVKEPVSFSLEETGKADEQAEILASAGESVDTDLIPHSGVGYENDDIHQGKDTITEPSIDDSVMGLEEDQSVADDGSEASNQPEVQAGITEGDSIRSSESEDDNQANESGFAEESVDIESESDSNSDNVDVGISDSRDEIISADSSIESSRNGSSV